MPARIQRKISVQPAGLPPSSGKGPASITPFTPGARKLFRKVSLPLLAQFTSQLATLSEAGIPLVRSLNILRKQLPPGNFQTTLSAVAEELSSGNSLSDALAKHPGVFDRVYVNLVRAGEAGGILDQVLRRLSYFLERSQEIRSRIQGAFAYPLFVTAVAILILSGVFLFVIPKFEEIFDTFDVPLPAPTEILIGASRFVVDFWYLVVGMPLLGWVFLTILYRRWNSFHRFCHKKILSLPGIGNLLKMTLVSRFSRTLGTLISSGVPHLEALSIVRDSAGNVVLAGAIEKIRSSVSEGEGIARSMEGSGVFDEILVNMVEVGEETGELDRMLLKVADSYDREADKKVEIYLKILEPALVVAMAVVVGFIVFSLFLPLLRIMETLGTD